MTAPIRRLLLGRANRVYGRMRVYLVPNGLEVDETDHGQVYRKRVFFDDVLAVTYHRYFGRWFLILTGLGAALFGLAARGLFSERGGTAGGVVMLFVSLAFLGGFALRLVFRVDAVTVFGRRSKAELLFGFRKARARAVYADLCRRAREAQPTAPPPAASEVPPSPPGAAPAPGAPSGPLPSAGVPVGPEPPSAPPTQLA